MPGGPPDLVRRWIDAYSDSRDDDLVALAHPDVVLHPRRGQGEREYRGIDGVRRWLTAAGSPRPRLSVVAIEELEDGRVIAETRLDDTDLVAVFRLHEGLIAAVDVYFSDREMLEHLEEIGSDSPGTGP